MSEASLQPELHSPAPLARSFVQRLTGTLRLDAGAYDEVAADTGALGQAAAIVGVAALARAIGSPAGPLSGEGIQAGVWVAAHWPLIAGLVWALANWFGHPVRFMPVLRVIGFAMAPLALWVLSAVRFEPVQVVSTFLAFALLIAGFVVGTRQVLKVPTGRAGFVTLVVALLLFFGTMVVTYLQMMAAAS